MRFEFSSPLLENTLKETRTVLNGKRIYVSFGHRLLLQTMCLVPPIRENLVGAASEEDECMEDIKRLQPDLLFCTEDLEIGYGISLVQQVKRFSENTKVLMFLSRENAKVVDKCLESGVDGVMFISSLGTGDGDFVRALRKVSQGGTYFPSDVQAEMKVDTRKLEILKELSIKETEVLRYISNGFSNEEIAKDLVLSTNTIKTHVRNILQKLQKKDRTQLAVLALKNGITNE
jgi:DNA-binding NarL/FixJ family response regulator